MNHSKRLGKPQAVIFTQPQALPIWIIEWEVWRDGQLYKAGSMQIPAATEQDAPVGVDTIMRDLMPNLFLNAEVRLVSTLRCKDR